VEASRYFMLATAVLLGYLAAAASPIISVWLGASMSPAVSIMLLLCVTYVISNMTVVGSTMVRAIGRPRFETEYSVINASVNVVASLILVHPYSYFGVVLGTLCGAVAGLVYFQWMLHRVYAIPVGPGLISWFWKIAVATLAGGAVVWAALHFADPFFAGHRLVGLIAIGLAGIAYLAIVGGMLIALRFFGDGDLARLRAILPRQLAGRFMPRAS
jgi:O-antigen/teichoic acid export membrane protein